MKTLLVFGALALASFSFRQDQDPPRHDGGGGRMQPMMPPGGGGATMAFAWSQVGNATNSTNLFIVKGNTLFKIDTSGDMKVAARLALEELPPSKPPKPKDDDR